MIKWISCCIYPWEHIDCKWSKVHLCRRKELWVIKLSLKAALSSGLCSVQSVHPAEWEPSWNLNYWRAEGNSPYIKLLCNKSNKSSGCFTCSPYAPYIIYIIIIYVYFLLLYDRFFWKSFFFALLFLFIRYPAYLPDITPFCSLFYTYSTCKRGKTVYQNGRFQILMACLHLWQSLSLLWKVIPGGTLFRGIWHAAWR